MSMLALMLATAVVAAPTSTKVTPKALKEAQWRIRPNQTLIAPAHHSGKQNVNIDTKPIQRK